MSHGDVVVALAFLTGVARSARSPTASSFLLSDRGGVVTGSVIDWDQAVVGGSD
jgi:hypothetical protein